MNPKVLKCLEEELKASAAGFPGAHDDIVSYIRFEMLPNPELEHLILKECGEYTNEYSKIFC